MLFQGLLMLELLTISSMIPVWIQQVIASYEQDQKYLDIITKKRKKSISTPQLLGVDYITPQPMKRSISPLHFSKPVKLPPKAVLKNYSKSQKNHKMKNSIVLDSK